MCKIDFKVMRFGVPEYQTEVEFVPVSNKAKERFNYGIPCVSVNVHKWNMLAFIKQLESEGFICEYF